MRKRTWLIVSVAALAGCATTVWYGSPSNVTSKTLAIGMSQQHAQSLWGPPQGVSTQRLQGVIVETWKYLDKTLTFHNGLLASWVVTPPAQGHAADATP